MAPTAEPICVTMPHHNKAFLPPSRSVVAMLTLENVMKADSRTYTIITKTDPLTCPTNGGFGLCAANTSMYIDSAVPTEVVLEIIFADKTGRKNAAAHASGLAIIDSVATKW